MAITADTWNLMTLKPFSDVAWTGLSDPPGVDPTFMKIILAGSTFQGYIISDGDPFTIAIENGLATLPAGVVASESLVTSVSVMDNNGTVTSISRDGAGNSLWYSPLGLQVYDGANTADINTITT